VLQEEQAGIQEVARRQMENQLLEQRLDVYKKHPWLMESNELLGGSTAQQIGNTAKGVWGMFKNAQSAKAAKAAAGRTSITETSKYDKYGRYQGGSATTRGNH